MGWDGMDKQGRVHSMGRGQQRIMEGSRGGNRRERGNVGAKTKQTLTTEKNTSPEIRDGANIAREVNSRRERGQRCSKAGQH